ncbi:ABC transporter ATP-binding protein [Algoriphagus namhaensis]
MEHSILIGKNIHLGYQKGKAHKPVISGLDVSLQKSKMTCLLGRNGVGKSTLIRGLLGQIPLVKGEITLQGKPLSSFTQEALAKRISVVLTESSIPGNMTVEQLVSLGRTPHTPWHGRLGQQDYHVVEKALESTKITDLRKERIHELSDGQRQKTMIARALAQEGEIMILDEPTAHLDLVGRHEIMELLQQIAILEDKAVLVVTHNIELAIETAHDFWLLIHGARLLSGKPEDLILTGTIQELLPEGNFHFDLEKGKLTFSLPNFNGEIHGPERLTYWIKQALIKAGIHAYPFPISIDEGSGILQVNQKSYSTLSELIQDIKGNP